ncbi:Aste57867_10457 [Aphanomyces stellatus]|uniref:Aste57867_10457 protein n=1 Tax=Aphanomyces stellatus TaxID=120398 RepID=A0A485KR26_9STRA|nr:hypothetical protein As57867_010417 [Aphanomyces stellatus]VFT87331.1 Aste57867_10457 [Aphanomyces stellatus]
MQINDPSYGEYATTNNATQASVFSSALYAIAIQDEVNTLPNVVQGIRAMDSCNLPWIATAYCYADFGQRWPMAYSTRRQQRCQAEIDNGAVYLEAILRNADWPSLSKCWGAALETAILSGIRGSNTGNAWITSVQSNSLSVEGEVKFWQAQKITRFTTQWQNYKKLGVTESFIVANAMGVDYPLTLKRSNSTFHVSAATSFKMYWSLATDLTQVMTNGSTLSGLSLLQNTPTYAYANTTLQSVMLQGKVALVPPLDPSLAVFASTIGPFGVVDLKRVSTPQSLRDLYRSMSQFIMTKLSSSDVIQQAFWSIYVLSFFTPQPQAWDTFSLWGGDINCGLNYGGSFSTPFQFFSSNGVCGNYLTDYTSPYTQNVLMAILASGSYNMNAKTQTAISNRDSTHHAAIATILNSSTGFLNQYFTQTELSRFQPTAQMVKSTIRDVVKLELFHYLSYDNVNYNLSRVNLFSPAEPDFEYFSWLYLFEWVEGKREVVSFQGDLDTITTLSTVQNFDERPANQQEIPRNVSFYFLTLIEYITIVLFGVGCLVCIYIVSSHGYIEGSNMISFGLVAGHVWIGRPLILLRGFTAICLLSTSSLNLTHPRSGLVSYFDAPGRKWFTTLLSCSEMSWLVNVIIDTCSVFTQEYTDAYSKYSVSSVVLAAAAWSFVSPTSHVVGIGRLCVVTAVDFDVACTSGRVEIGAFGRCCGLIVLALGGNFVCYAFERLRHPTPPPKLDTLSHFLYSTAKTSFEHSIHASWEHGGVYYLDKASAALTGVLTFAYDGHLYILDTKMWRVYIMTPKQLAARNTNIPPHLRHALPLV